MEDAYVLHRLIRTVARWGVWSFFTRVHVIGGEDLPNDGPMVVTATHHNMMLDPAVLSSTFPNQRILHYWSKASLFVNPIMKYILVSTGNIPVERKSKDHMSLLKSTVEALENRKAIAIFPEGTSYTEPRIMQMKDGAAWAALEYSRLALERQQNKPGKDVVIVPAAIVYTNKSKYRSDVIVQYGKPISVDHYLEDFMSSAEGASRAAVKALTHEIEIALVSSTINAADWDTLYAARMARDLLWQDEKSINLDDFVPISQTLVDLFSTPDVTSNFNSVKRRLLEYYSLLQSTGLTNSVLSSLPLPPTLDPNQPVPLPSRLYTLMILVRDSVSLTIRIPFFFFPLVVHTPVYIMGRLGARLVEDEEETQAQNKVVVGLLLLMMIYPSAFLFLWAFMWYTPGGALCSAATVWLFAMYHNRLINSNYERAKRLLAAWRVLVGVWAPKRWEMSVTALSQYTTPVIPPENVILQKSMKKSEGEPAPSVVPTTSASMDRSSKRRRAPSRKIIRHVLRARAEAVKALVSFFAQLEKEQRQVRSSVHLAERYGNNREGIRHTREVVQFLRKRGARIVGLENSINVEGEWLANPVSSDWEGENSDAGAARDDNVIWVPSSYGKE